MLRNLPDLYKKDGNIEKMLKLHSLINDDLVIVFGDIKDSHHVGYATGISLDYLGSLVACVRTTGESDNDYRSRIQAQISNFVGGGTKEAIKIMIAGYLGITTSDVDILDGYLDAYEWTGFITLLMFENDLLDYFTNHNGAGAPTYVDAHYGKGIKGNVAGAQVTVTDHADFNTPDFSVCAWAKVPTLAGGPHYIMYKGPAHHATHEWYVRIADSGEVEVFIDNVIVDCVFDTGPKQWEANDELFIMLTWDNVLGQAKLYVGEANELTLYKYSDTTGTGGRVFGTEDIKICEFGDTSGWVDQWFYDDAVIGNFDTHMAYGVSFAFDTYGHFAIVVFDWVGITIADFAGIINSVNEIKAAGVKCDYVALGVLDSVSVAEATSYEDDRVLFYEIVSVTEDATHCHYTDVTYVNSLNVVCS